MSLVVDDLMINFPARETLRERQGQVESQNPPAAKNQKLMQNEIVN
jgi:hypothetical protein